MRYPIELDLAGRRVLVVGLGAVGLRRARGLADAGARVVGVDPRSADLAALNGVEVLAEAYRHAHLEGMVLVIAAATVEVNRRVVEDARERGIWVNCASEPDRGDFRVPAVWREGGVTLTVSTDGASPGLSRALRDRAAVAIGREGVALAAIVGEFRGDLIRRVADRRARREVLCRLGDAHWLDLCARDGPEAVRAAMRRLVEGILAERTTGEG